MNDSAQNSKLLSIGQAAKMLGVSSRTLLRWEERDIISPIKTLGGQRRYESNQIDDLIQKQKRHKKRNKVNINGIVNTPTVVTSFPDYQSSEVAVTPANYSYIPTHAQTPNQETYMSTTPTITNPSQAHTSFTSVEESEPFPNLYDQLPSDRKKVVKATIMTPLVVLALLLLTQTILPAKEITEFSRQAIFQISPFISEKLGIHLPAFGNDKELASLTTKSRVLAAESLENPIFAVNVDAEFRGDVNIEGQLSLEDDFTFNGDLLSDNDEVNLFNTGVTTLNIGGEAATLSLGSSSSTTTVNGNIVVSGTTTLATTTITNLTISGDTIVTTIEGDEAEFDTVTGGSGVFSTITVSGLSTLNGLLDANGTGINDIAGTLNLSGDLLTSTTDLTINPGGGGVLIGDGTPASADMADGDLYVTGDFEVGGTIYGSLAGDVTTSLSPGSVIFVNSSQALDGDTNNFFWDESSNRLGLGTTAPSATLTNFGTTVLGDATGDTVTLNGYLGSHLIPTTASTYDLGDNTRTWRTIYVDNVIANNITTGGTDLNGTTSNDFRINTDNATIDTENATLTFDRGTPSVNAEIRWDATNKWISTNVPSFSINPSGETNITYSGKAALLVNQVQNQDLITASSSGTTRLTLKNDGKLGLGTTAPNSIVHLRSADPTIIYDTTTATDTDFWAGVIEDAGGDDDDVWAIGDGTTPGTNTFMSINTSGNVGIGTTAPDTKLRVSNGEIYGNYTLTSTETTTHYGIQSQLFHSTSVNQANGSAAIFGQNTVSGSGYVQGESAIYGKMYVDNTAGSNTILMAFRGELDVHPCCGVLGTGSVYNALMQNNNTSLVSNLYGFNLNNLVNSGTVTNTYGYYAGDLTTGTQTNTPYSFYASDSNAWNYFAGNVGIGTTSPVSLLSLKTTSAGLSTFTGTTNGLFTLENDNNTGDRYTTIDFRNPTYTSSNNPIARIASQATFTGTYLHLGTSNSYAAGITNTALTINPSGNIGIGTTVPGGKLHVAGSSFPFFVDSTGNVGIGTTVPQTILDVRPTATTGTGTQVLADSITTGTGILGSFDALTTGNGLYLESTSTTFSSGNLASLYWNPGSSTTATGDLMRLNVGSNGVLGNILNVMNGGSSVFSVSQSQITSALPHQFTAAGDVSIQYDLQFTNQTASYIKSLGPLQVESGESFENNNLTLKTYGTGNVVFDLTGTGYLQIAGTDSTIIYDTKTATDTDFWTGVVDDAGSDDDDVWAIGDGSTPGSNTFWSINTTGNIGIGTTAQTNDIDIIKAGNIVLNLDSNNSADLYLDKGATTQAALIRYKVAGANQWIAGTIDSDNWGDGTQYFIGTSATSASSAFLTINTSGNVGIGTTIPGAKLETFASSAYVANKVKSGALYLDQFANSNNAAVGHLTASQYFLYTDGGTTPAFAVNTSGNIGIGTTTQQSKLDIEGGLAVGATYSGTSVAPTNGLIVEGRIGIGNTSPGYALEIHDATNTPNIALTDDDVAHGLTNVAETDVFWRETSLSSTAGGALLTAISDTDAPALEIRGVIGSTDPTDTTAAVTIVGAKANGITGSTSLDSSETVFAVTNFLGLSNALTIYGDGSLVVGNPTGGAKGMGTINAVSVYDDDVLLTDYVFDKYFDGEVRPEDIALHGNYSMMSIDQMGIFLAENRHLPTIAGRDEWQASGKFSLGALVTDIWETVETNSLYILELNSEIKGLANQKDTNPELLNDIQDLASRVTTTENNISTLSGDLESLRNELEILKGQTAIASTSAVLSSASESATPNLNLGTPVYSLDGVTSLTDTVITGKLNVGLLELDSNTNSLNAIGTLKLQDLAFGNVEIMSNKIEIDTKGNINIKQGQIVGNDTIRGSETILAGESQVVITKTWDSAPKSITVTPNYNTNVWITEKTENGFTINVANYPLEDATIDWFAVW